MALLKRKAKKSPPQPGKLIVIDGIDGSGKTTQFNLLANTLRLSGYQVKSIKFPRHGEKSAHSAARYLNGEHGDLNAYAASIFYAVDRFEASAEIKQWLEEGNIVLVDRYVTANAGHQGGKIKDRLDRLKYFKWLNDLEHKIFNIPKPDLNIILHVPAGVAQRFIKPQKTGRRDIHEEDLKHLKNAGLAFVEIAKLFPNTKMVECTAKGKMLSAKQIHNQVWELVRRIALRDLKPSNTWLLLGQWLLLKMELLAGIMIYPGIYQRTLNILKRSLWAIPYWWGAKLMTLLSNVWVSPYQDEKM